MAKWTKILEKLPGARTLFPNYFVLSSNDRSRGSNWFPFGFHAEPRRDDVAVSFPIQGNWLLNLPGSPQDRPELQIGEVSLYHPDSGSKVVMKADGSVQIDSVTGVFINSGAVETGDIAQTVHKLVDERFKLNFDNHTHWVSTGNRNTSGPENGVPLDTGRGSASPLLIDLETTTQTRSN